MANRGKLDRAQAVARPDGTTIGEKVTRVIIIDACAEAALNQFTRNSAWTLMNRPHTRTGGGEPMNRAMAIDYLFNAGDDSKLADADVSAETAPRKRRGLD